MCYDSLGCFSSRHPYTNTPGILPRDPDDIGARFLLTREDTEDRYENIGISSHQRTLPCQTLNSRVTTKIIIHGYIHSVEEQWVINMVKELLKHVSHYSFEEADQIHSKPYWAQKGQNCVQIFRCTILAFLSAIGLMIRHCWLVLLLRNYNYSVER